MNSVARALRASYISAGFFVLSCGIVLVTHDTVGWLTIALVWLGHVTVTDAELFQSAGHWGFMSELTDVAMEQGSLGWVTIATIVIVATLTMGRSAAAERYLARHGSAA